jgi:hypothetical protein
VFVLHLVVVVVVVSRVAAPLVACNRFLSFSQADAKKKEETDVSGFEHARFILIRSGARSKSEFNCSFSVRAWIFGVQFSWLYQNASRSETPGRQCPPAKMARARHVVWLNTRSTVFDQTTTMARISSWSALGFSFLVLSRSLSLSLSLSLVFSLFLVLSRSLFK